MFTHPYIASQLAQQRRLEFLAQASARPSRGTRRFPRLPRPVLAAGAAAAVIAAVFAAMAAASVPAHAATGRVVAATSTVNDYWEQTNHNINMSSAGGTQAPIMTLNLPAGRWILHADQTMVNFGPSDYAGCTISDPSNPDLNSHGTIVGDPNAAGAWGPASFVASLSRRSRCLLAQLPRSASPATTKTATAPPPTSTPTQIRGPTGPATWSSPSCPNRLVTQESQTP